MISYYICAIFTLISSAVSFGFSIDTFLKARQEKNALTNAKYAMSRSASLLIVAIGLLIFKDSSFLIALSVVMIGVQLFDGIIGFKISIFKTVGPLFTALGNTLLLINYLFNR
ncbi:hypothetical protein M2139_001615 [Enterococcus sp. PF1-24]|uniref:hypothetical protein n=1 Tax=unclassified Enterococcus TaxID=2608891 RepID=UPI00247374A1|nr:MULTISPECIES: hypothetical protein [unclassified Enterococcus]MDH6364628.1 hypothetical protein [Enterococcus sp. PFB1-1]MDH6401729.1 hypothetical protein [Enterococcus sp. PF1-24]